jgi:hypothetical protein
MHPRSLHFSPRIFSLRTVWVSAGIIALMLVSGCQHHKITLTDFSKTFKLSAPAAGSAVVGLLLETELDASAPILLNVGCNGVVQVRLRVPNGLKFTQRIDWYSDCAELSFSTGTALPKSMTIQYRFLTL